MQWIWLESLFFCLNCGKGTAPPGNKVLVLDLLDMIAYFQYLIMRGFRCLTNLFPEDSALWLGRQLGRMRLLSRPGAPESCPSESDPCLWAREVKRRVTDPLPRRRFQHLGMTAVEFFRIPGMDLETFRKQVTVEGLENVKELLDNRKKGALLLLSHLGNWELMGFLTKVLGYPISVIARPVKKNPWVDRHGFRDQESHRHRGDLYRKGEPEGDPGPFPESAGWDFDRSAGQTERRRMG